MSIRFRLWIAVLFASTLSSQANAWDSAFVAPAPGYAAEDVATTQYFGGFDLFGNEIVGFAGGSLGVYDLAGTLVNGLGNPADYFAAYSGNVFNSFVRLDPTLSSAWVGFSVIGNLDDRIYQVDFATGVWSQRAVLGGNYDLEFFNGTPFVSGLNSSSFFDPNRIWLLDTSGLNAHDLIADVGGLSAGLAFDSDGNLYYGASDLDFSTFQTTGQLLMYTASQVAGAIGGSSLSRGDAILLSDLPGGGFDTDVDDANNVLFTFNGASAHVLGVWNGTPGAGENFVILAKGSVPDSGNFLTYVDSEGDVFSHGGAAYVADYGFPGVARVTAVPEASSFVLAALACALVGVPAAKRRFLHKA